MKKVVVIGAGAAGMMAAATAANRGLDVTLIEKNHRVGRKILITGKGRCNITNDCDIEELIENVPTNFYIVHFTLLQILMLLICLIN